MASQIWPFSHQDLLAEHQLPVPKGILWQGQPGCGKSLIAKRRWFASYRVLRRDKPDVKRKIGSPNVQAAKAIFVRYLTNEIPSAEGIRSEL